MIKSALQLAFILSIAGTSAGFFVQQTTSAATRVSMSSAVATRAVAKHKALEIAKNRLVGRSDIGSMSGESEADYQAFVEADKEETDPPKSGQTITGTVIEMDDNGALLEIGGKMSGYLPVKEASLLPIKEVSSIFEVGQKITAEVIGTLKGMPVLSLRSAQLAMAWEQVLNMRAADAVFEVKVLEVNKGGAICSFLGLKAFLPGSHYLGLPDASLVGQVLKVKFLDVIEDEGKLVVSQRRALAESQNSMFKKGDVVTGTITGLRNYGAFLELEGGMAGLLHISQISYDRIDNLEKLFQIGQKCKVMILEHDKANSRVALSTKTLEVNPGDMLKDMTKVFANAEETARKFHERMESERKAREAAAKDIVAGLGGSVSASGADPLVSVAESIESILASIVSDKPESK
jgi:small subunit ribosomal protein S1